MTDHPLIAFYGARLDDEETRARDLLRAAQAASLAVKEPRLLGREIPGWHSWPDVEAMCESALREIEAKRAILAKHHAETPSKYGRDEPRCAVCLTDRGRWPDDWSGDPWPCRTVRVSVAVWDGDPGYDPSWAAED